MLARAPFGLSPHVGVMAAGALELGDSVSDTERM
jgi:hypothetical protein